MNKETLEEALKSYVLTMSLDQSVYIDFLQCAELGAKWQQERSYSEEDMREAFNNGAWRWRMHSKVDIFKEWLKTLKKK